MKDFKREKRSDRAGFREVVCRALDIVPDTLPGVATVEIRGQNYVSIKEGGRILLYTPERITVALPKGAVTVIGKRLLCSSYFVGSVRVEGLILSVSFEEC